MAGLRELNKKLKGISSQEIEQDLLAIVQTQEEPAIALNQRQLLEGLTSQGNVLPNYSQTSVLQFNKEPGPWTLRDTGNFFRGFFMTTKAPNLAAFNSKDSKTDTILEHLYDRGARNPEEIFGHQDSNKETFYSRNLVPRFREYFLNLLRV